MTGKDLRMLSQSTNGGYKLLLWMSYNFYMSSLQS